MVRNMTSYRDLSHNRDFTVLWVAATISELGLRVSSFVMPLVAFAMTGSAFWAATAEAVYLGGLVIALLPAGVLADRWNRRHLMRGAMGAGALLYASLSVAGVAGSLSLGHLLVVCALSGLASGVFTPAETSAIRTVVPSEQLPTAMSQLQARQHVASLLGGPLGGALLGVTRWFPFLTGGLGYALGWLLVGRMRTDLRRATRPSGERETPTRPMGELVDGLRFIWRRPMFRVLLFSSPLLNLTINATAFATVLRLVEGGYPAWSIGLAEAAMGVSGILGALAAPWLIDRIPTGRLMVLSCWVFVPLAIPMALWVSPVVLAAVLALGIFFNPAGNAGISSYRMAVTPPGLIGRVQSAMQFAAMLTMPLAPILGGALLALLGGRDAILLLGALTGAVALLPTLARSVRSVPRPAEWDRLPVAVEPLVG